jgi:hypothetical protein
MRGRAVLDALPALEASSAAEQPCIVFDEQDHAGNLRFALTLSDPLAGVLTVDITPGTRRTYQLANDILTALGKRFDISGAAQTSHEAWFRACAWIVGERVQELIVCRAHLLDRFRWERLVELAAIARARLWLVVHRPSLSRAQREAARDWGMRAVGFAQFRRLWRPSREVDPGRRVAERVDPAVPDEEFPTFLAKSRRMLMPDAFGWVGQIHAQALDQTTAWFEKIARSGHGALSEVAIADFLYSLLVDARGLSEMLVRARAAQSAAFNQGWLIKVNQAALAGAYFAAPLSKLDGDACSALRMYGHPRYAAAAAISLASREPPSSLVQLNLADIETDGSDVRFSERIVPIPEAARGVTRAQLAYRLAEAAGPDDPLFVSEKRSPQGRSGRVFGRTTAHGLHQRLATLAIETGLSVIAAEPSGRTDPKRWLRRQGVTVHRIPATAGRS